MEVGDGTNGDERIIIEYKNKWYNHRYIVSLIEL